MKKFLSIKDIFASNKIITCHVLLHFNGWGLLSYSVRKLFTGLEVAALMVWILKVSNAITSIADPLTTNTHQLISVL